jgi:pimeloyl-ACP methyl ester carboxylesterase
MPLPVVLLHAFPLSSQMWQPLRAALPADVELITPDLRGAPGAALGGAEPSLDVLADDVARLLDDAKVEQAIIGGLSMGGYVTMAFLRRHADRVAGVVLADTRAVPDAEPARANRLRIAEILDTEGTARVLVDEVLPTLVGSTTKAERAAVMAHVTAMVEATLPASGAWWERAMAARPDSFDTLRACTRPALVIVGEEDTLTPQTDAQAMVDVLAMARLVVLPQAGHLSAVESPDAFAAALLGFIQEFD